MIGISRAHPDGKQIIRNCRLLSVLRKNQLRGNASVDWWRAVGDGGGEGRERRNRDRKWPGVCCSNGNVADVAEEEGRWLARVTLKNDRRGMYAHATIFQLDLVKFPFAKCRQKALLFVRDFIILNLKFPYHLINRFSERRETFVEN